MNERPDSDKQHGSPEKRARRSKEEIELDRIQKLERKEERAKAKKEKERIKEEKRLERLNPPTEEELVHKYVNRIINNEKYHGRINDEKFSGISNEKKANKNIWMDNDFYFSVVFQSAEQKYKFLEAVGIYEEDNEIVKATGKVKIINGLEFAERLDIELEKEEVFPYPTGNLDLLPYLLDTEDLTVKE